MEISSASTYVCPSLNPRFPWFFRPLQHFRRGARLRGNAHFDVENCVEAGAVTISGGSVALAVFFSAGVGIAFGLWPARRASKLNPIQALRYE